MSTSLSTPPPPPSGESEVEYLRLWFRRGMFTGHAILMIRRCGFILGSQWTVPRIKEWINAEKTSIRSESPTLASAIQTWQARNRDPNPKLPNQWFDWNKETAALNIPASTATREIVQTPAISAVPVPPAVCPAIASAPSASVLSSPASSSA